MINLSLDELRLSVQNRNIKDYEYKPEEDLIKALSEPKPKIRINKKKLEEIRKDFNELRHKFSKKEIDKYRKAFYVIKNYKHLSTSEIEEARKNLIELRKSLRFKKFHGDIDSIDYDDLDNYDDDDFADDDEYRKVGSIRRLFENFYYYKPINTDDDFAGRRNNYIQYTSRGDRYKNLSPKEYLDMIGPYLRDLIDGHKPTTELNNNDDEHGEWKIQLVMQNKCISTKNFEDTCDVYSTRKPIEIFMGVDIDDTIDRLFDTLLQRFQKATETLNANGSGFTDENIALMYYNFMKKDIRRAESYVKSPNWIANKGATVNPKNIKNNKCFQYSITSGLNYIKLKRNI